MGPAAKLRRVNSISSENDIVLASSEEVSSLIEKLASDIYKAHAPLKDFALIGILSGGFPLALRIRNEIERQFDIKLPVGKMDISLYRDDLHSRGNNFMTMQETDIPFEVSNKHIVLVDDVLYHGRTARAALDGMSDFGRAKSITFAALVDRGHREMPIFAHHVGLQLDTMPSNYIKVRFLEVEGEDSIILKKNAVQPEKSIRLPNSIF